MYRPRQQLHASVDLKPAPFYRKILPLPGRTPLEDPTDEVASSQLSQRSFTSYNERELKVQGIHRNTRALPPTITRTFSTETAPKGGTKQGYALSDARLTKTYGNTCGAEEEVEMYEKSQTSNYDCDEGVLNPQRNLATPGNVFSHSYKGSLDMVSRLSPACDVAANSPRQKRLRYDPYDAEKGARHSLPARGHSYTFPSSDATRLEGAAYPWRREEVNVQAADLDEDEPTALIFSSQDEQDASDTRQQCVFYASKLNDVTGVQGVRLRKDGSTRLPHFDTKSEAHAGVRVSSASFPFSIQPFVFSNSLSNFVASYGGRSRKCGDVPSKLLPSSSMNPVPWRLTERQAPYPLAQTCCFGTSNLLRRVKGSSKRRLFNTERPPLLAMPNTASLWRSGALGSLIKRCVFPKPLTHPCWAYPHRCFIAFPHSGSVAKPLTGDPSNAAIPLRGSASCAACVACALVCSLCSSHGFSAPMPLVSQQSSLSMCTLTGCLEEGSEKDDMARVAVTLLAYYIHNDYCELLFKRGTCLKGRTLASSTSKIKERNAANNT